MIFFRDQYETWIYQTLVPHIFEKIFEEYQQIFKKDWLIVWIRVWLLIKKKETYTDNWYAIHSMFSFKLALQFYAENDFCFYTVSIQNLCVVGKNLSSTMQLAELKYIFYFIFQNCFALVCDSTIIQYQNIWLIQIHATQVYLHLKSVIFCFVLNKE